MQTVGKMSAKHLGVAEICGTNLFIYSFIHLAVNLKFMTLEANNQKLCKNIEQYKMQSADEIKKQQHINTTTALTQY